MGLGFRVRVKVRITTTTRGRATLVVRTRVTVANFFAANLARKHVCKRTALALATAKRFTLAKRRAAFWIAVAASHALLNRARAR